MSLFYNNFQRLCQENADEIRRLSLSNDSWDSVSNIMEYLNSWHLSRFELEIIKKDLIGMAGEARKEGISFLDKLGMPEREFCESLIQSGIRFSWLEKVMPAIRNFFVMLFAYYLLDFFSSGCPARYGITYDWLIFVLLIEIYNNMVGERLLWRSMYAGEQKRKIVKVINIMIYMAIFAFLLVIPGGEWFAVGNGWMMLGILLFFALAAFFGNNFYWDKLSERYHWE